MCLTGLLPQLLTDQEGNSANTREMCACRMRAAWAAHISQLQLQAADPGWAPDCSPTSGLWL